MMLTSKWWGDISHSNKEKLDAKLKKENPDISDDDILDIPVTYDGTGSKRGHTANYGFGFVISVETGHVLIIIIIINGLFAYYRIENELQYAYMEIY
jgi:mRNA-degrading endonuclease RelE of RelBE toxin-antitoxin system